MIMDTNDFFTTEERAQLVALYRKLLQLSGDALQKGDCRRLKAHLVHSIQANPIPRDVFGLNPILKDMQTAVIVAEEIGMRRASILGVMLHDSVRNGTYTAEAIGQEFGEDVAGIIRGLILMRQIKNAADNDARLRVANEAAYLYAPLAHKLGLYKLKSELEDLSLKYTEHDVYYHIKEKLNETKASRDRYIARFIAPIQQKLEEAGLRFHIKGRTKSIHSIYQKMKKQKCPFEGVYDLFAIRVILDSPLEREKQECWQV